MKTLIIVALGVAAYVGASQIGGPVAVYIYVVPFAALTLVSVFNRSWKPVLAAVGAVAPIAILHCYFLWDVWIRLPREGGGANIGLGILLMLLPIIYSVTTFLTWIACGLWQSKSAVESPSDFPNGSGEAMRPK
ncbi:hypothetical protein [Planctomicrobium piriforme]|uniref:Uncharacterized protein n=1 Tax=Planctomicrobium piriforme TaxID=1576369 RepID=A0A1I3KBH0_9PLAN|nr:hypothetical protein [Planctomicrobium piriforme]SFI69648.1 hypothetical protein SAMN05421753_111172 [Planctomicrobium piriforme]